MSRLVALLVAASASWAIDHVNAQCGSNNCGRAVRASNRPGLADCSSFFAATTTPAPIPTYASACSSAAAYSSACSCLQASVSSTTQSASISASISASDTPTVTVSATVTVTASQTTNPTAPPGPSVCPSGSSYLIKLNNGTPLLINNDNYPVILPLVEGSSIAPTQWTIDGDYRVLASDNNTSTLAGKYRMYADLAQGYWPGAYLLRMGLPETIDRLVQANLGLWVTCAPQSGTGVTKTLFCTTSEGVMNLYLCQCLSCDTAVALFLAKTSPAPANAPRACQAELFSPLSYACS